MRTIVALLVGLVLAVSMTVRPAKALTEPELMVERARVTALTLLTDPDYRNLQSLVGRARAVMIVPNLIQAGFFVGGGGGTGVMVARGPDDGVWSGPAFYTLAEASFGLQFGGQASQLMLVIMTEKGLNAVLDRKVKLGADASVAVGELGTGVGAAYGVGIAADIYVYAKSSGLFGGAAIEGSVIAPRGEWNNSFYGQATTPRGILVQRQFYRPEAQALGAALSQVSAQVGGGAQPIAAPAPAAPSPTLRPPQPLAQPDQPPPVSPAPRTPTVSQPQPLPPT